MTDRVGGEGPAPHTPQQQQLYADSYALPTSGPSLHDLLAALNRDLDEMDRLVAMGARLR